MRVIELWRVVMTRARPTAGDERGGVVWGGCTVRAQSVGGAVMVTGVQMCAVALSSEMVFFVFFFQAEDGIRDLIVTGVQTCALPISSTPSTRIRIPCPFPSSYVSRRIFENRPSVRSPRFFEASIWRPGRSWWTAYITTDRKSVV